MKLVIHHGANQIGGSCVELQAGGARILIDFGMPLRDACGADFNERNLRGKAIQALIKDGVLPDIQGLYQGSSPSIDAILISHSHKDHYGFLSYVHPDIPVYISRGAYELVRALGIFLPAATTAIRTPHFLTNERLVKIRGCDVTPYLVDHAGFDAMGFLIREADTTKAVFYSGDFRAGGWTEYRYENLIRKPPESVDCLLMEGTSLERAQGRYLDERAVVQGVVEAINSSAQTVLPVYCSGQNIDRIVSLYKAALITKSLVVIDPYTACMLRVAGKVADSIPQVESNNIRVFVANYGCGDIYINRIAKSDLKEMIPGLGRKKIKALDFRRLEQKALLLMRDTMIPVVEQIPEIRNADLVYSQWQGYTDKKKASSKRFWDFVGRNNLEVEHIHTSGHATLEVLQEFASRMHPKQIVPIHTEHPEKFREHFGASVSCHKNGEWFDV